MNVGELLTVLSRADPEDIIVLQKCPDSLMLITTRLGMHQIVEDITGFTVEEEQWLREMHIQWSDNRHRT